MIFATIVGTIIPSKWVKVERKLEGLKEMAAQEAGSDFMHRQLKIFRRLFKSIQIEKKTKDSTYLLPFDEKSFRDNHLSRLYALTLCHLGSCGD